ncbi:RNA polymerase sigma factor RpoE [hydrothermal vent metagenome]|uniref:RNA polymerase sigma factor RpoE n=1 Tax=hydrothermal vent metagenome TaxID=652676 RepID=A0A3B0ZAZ8_9ZZZZ
MSHKPLPDDEQLISGLLKKDQATYLIVVKHYQHTMVNLARSIIGDAFAEEVVQESWLSMAKGLDKFERRSSFKTWLMRIVANAAKSRLRRESRQLHLGEYTLDNSPLINPQRFNSRGHWESPPNRWESDDPEALLSSQQLGDCLDKTIEKLPHQQRAALNMYEQQELPSREICNLLEISESNLRVLLHRARNRIRNMIEIFHQEGTC